MDENQEYTVLLKDKQFAWLKQMAGKHDLPDASKALRCLINFAMQEVDREEAIFEEIRCTDC
jgi:hypothetical protein